jgi:putative membrane protein
MKFIHIIHSRNGKQVEPMMRWLMIKWLCLTAAILFASYVIDGIYVNGFVSAFFTAAALGILNMFFKPFLIVLTLPINIMTLGLFTFIINALMLKMASGLIPGFHVSGFWAAIFGALLISAVNWFLNSVIEDSRSKPSDETIDLNRKDDHWE